jgi:hypothetical protein
MGQLKSLRELSIAQSGHISIITIIIIIIIIIIIRIIIIIIIIIYALVVLSNGESNKF